MNAATVSALAGAIGVVAGALVTSVGTVLHERVVGRREREAQEALRLQQLTDQRAAFQRDTILGLQEAISELWSQSADGFNQAAGQQAQTGEWPRPDLTVMADFNKVSARINDLRARVFDDELRALTSELLARIWAGIEAADWSQQPEHMITAREPMNRLRERINFLLKSLF
jgi:hypothetical protein